MGNIKLARILIALPVTKALLFTLLLIADVEGDPRADHALGSALRDEVLGRRVGC